MKQDIATIVDLVPTPLPTSHRFVIAVAGPPASGKSTLAAELSAAMPNAGLLGMDAFHYDNAILERRGDLARKGAPHTFDTDGYAHMLARLRSQPDDAIAVPEFDRSLELTRSAANIVTSNHRILVTEGNYLLLDDQPWPMLAPLFDLTVWLDVPIPTIERRITERWLSHGLDAEQAAIRLEKNDQRNAELVCSRSRRADISITQTDSKLTEGSARGGAS